jgi:hypothetical protein
VAILSGGGKIISNFTTHNVYFAKWDYRGRCLYLAIQGDVKVGQRTPLPLLKSILGHVGFLMVL